MGKRAFSPAIGMVAAFIFIMTFVVGTPAFGAQGTKATPGAQGGAVEVVAHPAHIHSGTCDQLGDVVFPLNDVTPLGIDVAAEATPKGMTASPVAEADATPVVAQVPGVNQVVAESTTDLDVSLDDILGSEHAINVHESAENIQNYIACGDLTGTATDGELQIELQELNNSGYIGEADLIDNGDGTTTVTVKLLRSGEGMTGTPEGTPSS